MLAAVAMPCGYYNLGTIFTVTCCTSTTSCTEHALELQDPSCRVWVAADLHWMVEPATNASPIQAGHITQAKHLRVRRKTSTWTTTPTYQLHGQEQMLNECFPTDACAVDNWDALLPWISTVPSHVKEEPSRVEGSEILDVELHYIYRVHPSPSVTFRCGRRIHALIDNLHANRCDIMRDAFLVLAVGKARNSKSLVHHRTRQVPLHERSGVPSRSHQNQGGRASLMNL